MKVYTCVMFEGHYPVGAAAVIVAANKTRAAKVLMDELSEIGLPQKIDCESISEIQTNREHAMILHDGNY